MTEGTRDESPKAGLAAGASRASFADLRANVLDHPSEGSSLWTNCVRLGKEHMTGDLPSQPHPAKAPKAVSLPVSSRRRSIQSSLSGLLGIHQGFGRTKTNTPVRGSTLPWIMRWALLDAVCAELESRGARAQQRSTITTRPLQGCVIGAVFASGLLAYYAIALNLAPRV